MLLLLLLLSQDYLSLSSLKRTFPGVVLTCLTATATEPVVANVQQILGMAPGECVLFKQSFNRPNLIYEVKHKGVAGKGKKGAAADPADSTGVVAQIADWVNAHYPNQSGIIYCLSKKDCESVSADLQRKGLSIDFYHAGLDQQRRKEVQDNWSLDRVKIIVATIAFGMGQLRVHFYLASAVCHRSAIL